MQFFFVVSLFALCALFVGCAGSGGGADGGGDGASGMADAPCEECGKRGDIELKISQEKFYREWNPAAYRHFDSSAVVGVFPTLKVVAKRPESCKMCHSFSADALDFDLARVEDSLFVENFPRLRRELMLPGMRLPDQDSAYVDTLSVMMLKSVFADGRMLEDFEPWETRHGIEQSFERVVPQKLKDLLNGIAKRYGLHYLSVPVALEVEMLPKVGKSGGFTWKILWSLWDARYGELVFLTYSEFLAETTSRVSPEKEWSEPFASRLQKMFTTDFTKLEGH
ncbi:MAG: hypothetical protein HUK21_07025 [Fibrobacteraceae bacterium]|nr:hypothetical protein [Fibrobacteraceae bacterium]